jgi:hypothetical protein
VLVGLGSRERLAFGDEQYLGEFMSTDWWEEGGISAYISLRIWSV